MIYQLVLITNLGLMTQLGTYTDQSTCLRERAMISKTAQYSAECLPTQNNEQFKMQLKEQTQLINSLILQVQK